MVAVESFWAITAKCHVLEGGCEFSRSTDMRVRSHRPVVSRASLTDRVGHLRAGVVLLVAVMPKFVPAAAVNKGLLGGGVAEGERENCEGRLHVVGSRSLGEKMKENVCFLPSFS